MTTPIRFADRPPRGLAGSLRSGRALAGRHDDPHALRRSRHDDPIRFADRPPRGLAGSLRSGRALAGWRPSGQRVAETAATFFSATAAGAAPGSANSAVTGPSSGRT